MKIFFFTIFTLIIFTGCNSKWDEDEKLLRTHLPIQKTYQINNNFEIDINEIKGCPEKQDVIFLQNLDVKEDFDDISMTKDSEGKRTIHLTKNEFKNGIETRIKACYNSKNIIKFFFEQTVYTSNIKDLKNLD